MNTHRPVYGVLTGTLTEGVQRQEEVLEEAQRVLKDAGFRLELTIGPPWRGELGDPRPMEIPADAPRPEYSSIDEIETALRLWSSLRSHNPSSDRLRAHVLANLGYFQGATLKERQGVAVFYCGDPLSQVAAARQLGISTTALIGRISGAVRSMEKRLLELRREYIKRIRPEDAPFESVAVLDLPPWTSCGFDEWDKLRTSGLITVNDVACSSRSKLLAIFDVRHLGSQEEFIETLSRSLAQWGLQLKP